MSGPTPPPVVLVVDDNLDFAESIAILLESHGQPAIAVATVRGALDALDENPAIGLVVSDIRMPSVDGFDFHRVARYGEADIERLLGDAGIIRNRAKIVSTINNARRAIELIGETGSLAAWFWQFEPAAKDRPKILTLDYWQANPTSEASVALSKALKKRGWTFVGPTTVYAFMQAMGLVNDHLTGCTCRTIVEAERKAFKRPKAL